MVTFIRDRITHPPTPGVSRLVIAASDPRDMIHLEAMCRFFESNPEHGLRTLAELVEGGEVSEAAYRSLTSG